VTLKNKRLSQSDRQVLCNLAYKSVDETQDSAAVDTAYNEAASAVQAAVLEKYPQKDMEVLKKYNAACGDACVYISLEGFGDYRKFCFRNEDKRIPLRPSSSGCNYRNPLLLEKARAEAVRSFEKAQAERKALFDERISDFKSLIYTARTFNEVAAVWPKAETLREAIVGTSSALVTLSEDVVKRIQSDPAYELKTA
jgi:hypothetical protein